jgi:two-component system, sensor histidine kinase and response regulator
LRSKADVFFELYRQRREWAQALQLNEMFVGILGHDLRNPLGALLTGAALLQAQLSDPKQLRTLQRMTSAGRRMTEMIEQLLDLTRARLAGGLGFGQARHHVDVTSLVQRAVEELQPAHPERRIVVLGDGRATTLGDPDRLLQLFSNLVANALHHGHADVPVHVEITASSEEVRFSVHNGGAIPDELLPTLFDPFRKRPAGRAHSHGLGLGLYISRQIALAHDGSIEVTSSEEAGTRFTLRMPRRSTSQPELAIAADLCPAERTA